MERLHAISSEVQLAQTELARELESYRQRESDLVAQLEAERAAFHSERVALIQANERLMTRTEELSSTVSRLQEEVMHLTRAQNDQLRALANSHVADTPILARSTSRARTVPSSTYRLEGSSESALSASRRPGSPDGYAASLSSSRAPASTQAVLAQVDQSVVSMRQGAEADLAAYKARLAAKLGSSAPVAVGAPLYSGATADVPPASPTQGSTTMGMGMRMSPMSEEEEERDRGSARVKQQGDGPVSLPKPAPVGRTGGGGGGYARKGGADPTPQPTTTASAAGAAGAGKTSADLQLGAEPRPEVRAGPVDMDRAGHVLAASGEDRQGGSGAGARVGHGQAVTVSSASTAAAAAGGRSSSAGRGSGVPVGARAGSAGKGGARAPSPAVGRRPSSTAAPASAPAPAPAPPPAAPSSSSSSTPSMSAPQFFSLLRTHVPPSALETLMAGLTLFNKGDISKGELMSIAGTSLGQAYPSSAPHGGSPPDLLAMFKSLILRV